MSVTEGHSVGGKNNQLMSETLIVTYNDKGEYCTLQFTVCTTGCLLKQINDLFSIYTMQLFLC